MGAMDNPGSGEGMEDEYGNKDPTMLNLNNTSVFRTMEPEKKKEKYKEICQKLNESNIRSVLMVNCDVGDNFAKELASMLKKNSTITEVNLNTNPISSDGVQALCEALRVNT